MVNWKSKQLGDLLLLANGMAFIIVLNLLAQLYFIRIDLTEEKRFSIKTQTKAVLKNLDEPVYIEIFLAGDLNPSFTRFQKSIREIVEEFTVYSNNKVRFTFTDPAVAIGAKARNEFMQDLAARGIQPRNVIENNDGQRVEKIIFPGALISYGGFEIGVNLLKGNSAEGSESVINQSIEGLEYELINTIYKLTNSDRKQIGFITGHGELDSLEILSFKAAVREQYDVSTINLLQDTSFKNFDALIIAKPRSRFSDADKFLLDQYIMKGGKLLLLLDKLDATVDSASRDNYYAFPFDLNLDDQLFKYGVRINLDLIQDRAAALYPVVTGVAGGKPEMQLMDWPFFPLVNRYADHVITKNLDAVVTRFVSSVDTVKAAGVKKTPFMFSSAYARTITAPVRISINDIRQPQQNQEFSQSFIPIGYLLEGKFNSLFKNRFIPQGVASSAIKEQSVNTKIIVIADGDLARNDVNPRNGMAQPLGFDRFSNYTFANQELLMNALAWLVNNDGILTARNKEVKLRPLDNQRIKNEKVNWQVFNLVAPLLLILIFGLTWGYVRKKRFANF